MLEMHLQQLLLRLTATANGVCTDIFDEMDILVDATPSASVGADQEICDVSTATLDGNSAGTDLNNNARGEWAYSVTIWYSRNPLLDPPMEPRMA